MGVRHSKAVLGPSERPGSASSLSPWVGGGGGGPRTFRLGFAWRLRGVGGWEELHPPTPAEPG